MIDSDKIAARLKQLRKRQRWSCKQTARISGINQRTIEHLEAGDYQDYKLLTHIVPLCKAYKCSVQLFIASVEE